MSAAGARDRPSRPPVSTIPASEHSTRTRYYVRRSSTDQWNSSRMGEELAWLIAKREEAKSRKIRTLGAFAFSPFRRFRDVLANTISIVGR